MSGEEMNSFQKTFGTTVILFLISSPPLLAFQTLYTVGFGPRAIALAGAVEASPKDASTLWYNPAGANHFGEVSLMVSYLYLTPQLEFQGSDFEAETLRGIEGAIAFPFPFLGRKWTVGVGAFVPDQDLSRVRILPVTEPRFVIYNTDFHQISVFPSFSVDVTRYLTLGVLFSMLSKVEGEGQSIEVDTGTGIANVGFNLESQTRVAPSLGLYFEMERLDDSLPDIRIGLTFRDSISVIFGVPGDIDIQQTSGDTVQPLFTADSVSEASIFWVPRELALGFAYPFDQDRSLLLGGVMWRQWSEFPNQALQGVDIVSLFGGTPGKTNLPPFDDPHFKDTVNFKLGFEHRWVDRPMVAIDLRAGYTFQPSPAPDPTGETLNYLDNDKHIFSAGTGVTFRNFSRTILHPVRFDLFVQYATLPSRVAVKESPNDPVGDFDYGGYSVGAGAGFTFQF